MSSPEYLDCEFYLTSYEQARLSVADREYSGRPVLDEALQRRLLQAALNPTQYGTFLFEALLPGEGDDLLAGYREGLAIARHEEKCLRFRLHIATTAPAQLQELRWELLYDPKKKISLGRARDVAFSRYLSIDVEPAKAVTEEPKLLVVPAGPENLAKFNLPELDHFAMRQSLEQALSPLRGLMSWELMEPPATPGRIRDRLIDGGFHALHLQAHGVVHSGKKTAALILEDDDHQVAIIDERRFSEIFEGEHDLRLIILMACHSGAATHDDPFSGLGRALVERGIPAVVAMNQSISIKAATLFTEHFFRNLVRGGHVDTAVNEARQQLYLADGYGLEWGTPTLFMRLRDGRLWEPQAKKLRRHGSVRPIIQPEIWEGLLPWIDSGDFIPFLGPGMLHGLLPSNEEIANSWAERYGYPPIGRLNLPRVAQYVEMKVGRNIPHQLLPKLLSQELLDREQIRERKRLKRLGLTEVIDKIAERHFDRDANEPHRLLAELPVSTYVTTNYDSFMTAALRWQGREPLRRACIWKRDLDDLSSQDEYDDLEGTEKKPLIFHLYGNDLEPTSQVLTEDDYLDFIRIVARDFEVKIPSALRGGLSEAMLVFLGYNVVDLDCRVLFRGLVTQLKEPQRERIAVLQLERDERDEERYSELKFFMTKYCENVRIHVYWGSVREFLTELYRQWKAEYAES